MFFNYLLICYVAIVAIVCRFWNSSIIYLRLNCTPNSGVILRTYYIEMGSYMFNVHMIMPNRSVNQPWIWDCKMACDGLSIYKEIKPMIVISYLGLEVKTDFEQINSTKTQQLTADYRMIKYKYIIVWDMIN